MKKCIFKMYVFTLRSNFGSFEYASKYTRILDIGCGTGLTAGCIQQLGFKLIDGLDYSQNMVMVATQKEIYNELFVADLNQPLGFSDAVYGAVISSGTFTHGHVGCEPLDEILRIIKPQGMLACTVHQDLWQSRGFESKFKSLEEKGLVQAHYLKKGAFYKDKAPEGWFCIYQKI